MSNVKKTDKCFAFWENLNQNFSTQKGKSKTANPPRWDPTLHDSWPAATNRWTPLVSTQTNPQCKKILSQNQKPKKNRQKTPKYLCKTRSTLGENNTLDHCPSTRNSTKKSNSTFLRLCKNFDPLDGPWIEDRPFCLGSHTSGCLCGTTPGWRRCCSPPRCGCRWTWCMSRCGKWAAPPRWWAGLPEAAGPATRWPPCAAGMCMYCFPNFLLFGFGRLSLVWQDWIFFTAHIRPL